MLNTYIFRWSRWKKMKASILLNITAHIALRKIIVFRLVNVS